MSRYTNGRFDRHAPNGILALCLGNTVGSRAEAGRILYLLPRMARQARWQRSADLALQYSRRHGIEGQRLFLLPAAIVHVSIEYEAPLARAVHEVRSAVLEEAA
jgi:hypothetical protein